MALSVQTFGLSQKGPRDVIQSFSEDSAMNILRAVYEGEETTMLASMGMEQVGKG